MREHFVTSCWCTADFSWTERNIPPRQRVAAPVPAWLMQGLWFAQGESPGMFSGIKTTPANLIST